MSDSTPEGNPAAAAQDADSPAAAIDFDHAELPEGGGGGRVECAICHDMISTQYWQYGGKTLCGGCQRGVTAAEAEARRGATFGKAALRAGAVALACGVGYAIFVGLTHIQFALVTIGIGWVVGQTIQRVTRGFGARKHQVLAVALTYFASSMGYLPAVFAGLTEAADQPQQTTTAPAAAAGEPPAAPAPATTPAAERPGFFLSLTVFALISTVFMLAAPFLEIAEGFSGVLGVLIIFFGVRTAWQTSRGIQATMTGPHALAPSAGS